MRKVLENLSLQSTIPMEFESFLWNRFRRNKQISKGSLTLILSLVILKTGIFRSHCTVSLQPLLNTDRLTSIISFRYGVKFFLACRIPQHQSHVFAPNTARHRIKDRLITFSFRVQIYLQTTKPMMIRGYKHCFNMQRRFA